MSLHRMFARAAFVGLLAVVAYLSLSPDTGGEGFISRAMRWIAQALFGDAALADKLAHFSAYFALGAAAFWARISPLARPLWAPLGLLAYGALLEFAQSLGPTRQPELADAAVNGLGAFVGYFGLRWFISMLGRAGQ